MNKTDSVSTEFNLGTHTNTVTTGNSVMLAVGQSSGTYRSRVMDVFCGGLWSWKSFDWMTTIPYEKEITSSSETTAYYAGISNDLMNGLHVYYNFNETAANSAPGGTDFADRSGNNRNANETSIGAYGVAGKFLAGARLNGTSSHIAMTNFASTAKSYTFSFWFRTTMASTTLSYLFDNLDGTSRLIIAPTCSSALCSVQSKIGVCFGACSNIPSTTINSPNDGNWHHLVVTLDAATGNANVYLDYVNSFTYTTYGTTGYNLTNSSRLGARYDGSSWWHNGDIDEVAVWTRALSPAEVLQLYRRGANRVRFQFRSCTSPTCADNPAWRGPDGTTTTFFSELHNNSNQLAQNGNPLTINPTMDYLNFPAFAIPTNRYFQYLMTLQTDNTAYSPDVTFTRIFR